MKVTLDTNIIVSGFFWKVDSSKILVLVGMGAIQNIISREIFSEYKDVCFRREITEKTSKSESDIAEFLNEMKKISVFIEPKINFDAIKNDPKDNKFLDSAFEGNVDYIITYDKHLLELDLFNGIKILNPLEFLKVINL